MDKITYAATKQELISVPLPIQTNTYKPISHAELMDLTLESIHQSGFELEKEWYLQAADGQLATGNYAIRNVGDSEMQLRIAWQNSYNKQVSLKFALGAHVFVCSNGAVSGDLGAFKRKHTGDVQDFTPRNITEYIKGAGDTFSKMVDQRERLKEIEINKRTQAELVGRMYLEEDFIESTQLNIIKRELNKPTYDYGAPNSLWELYQFTTFGMKDLHPRLWMKNHLAAHEFFINEAGILVEHRSPVNAVHVMPNQLSLFDNTNYSDLT